MAAAAILKFTLMATTQSLSNIFTHNFAQRLKKTPRKQFYLQISLLRKSKMAAATIFKIGLKGYCKIKYTKKYTKLGQKLLVEFYYLKTH